MKRIWQEIALLSVVITVLVTFFTPNIPAARYSYDESDYMYAVSRGFFANYLDENSISLSVFLAKGTGEGIQAETQQELSDFIRASDDITFYRHYHAPLYYYWLALTGSLLGRSEVAMRSASFVILLLGAGAMYFICLALARENRHLAALIGVTFLLLGPVNTHTAMKITPHGLYALVVVVSLFCLSKLLEGGSIKYWYLSLFSLLVSFLTFEFAPLLLLTFLILVWRERRRVFTDLEIPDRKKLMIRSLAIIAVTLIIAWPGGIFKLTLLKNYLFFTYFTLVRGEAYGSAGLLEAWWQRIGSSPLEFVAVGVGLSVTAIFFFKRKSNPGLLPFLVYAALIFLATIRIRSQIPTYFSSLTMVIYVICAVSLAEALKGRQKLVKFGVPGVLILSLIVNNLLFVRPLLPSTISDPVLNRTVNHFLQTPPAGKLLLPKTMRPIFHYYMPDYNLVTYPRSAGMEQLVAELENPEVSDLILLKQAGDNSEQALAQYANISTRQDIYSSPDGLAIVHIILGADFKEEPE